MTVYVLLIGLFSCMYCVGRSGRISVSKDPLIRNFSQSPSCVGVCGVQAGPWVNSSSTEVQHSGVTAES